MVILIRYRNTSDNNLLYWGLDYPPVTAYASFFFGVVAKFIDPSLVELHSSRGIENVVCKCFMRLTVVLCDIILCFPTLYLWIQLLLKNSQMYSKHTLFQTTAFFISVNMPSLLLIDHGHFQYNGVCIGLALLGALAILNNKDVLGSILFCLSLNFKQMALYYSPVFFFCLIRKCCDNNYRSHFLHLLFVGTTVVTTFALLWLPFCIYHAPEETCTSSLLHVLHRLFPFERGIFEDKVSNIWFLSSVLFRIRNFFSPTELIRLSTLLTLTLISPVAYFSLRFRLNASTFLLSLTACALAFFLASFQVKTLTPWLITIILRAYFSINPLRYPVICLQYFCVYGM